MTEAVQYLELTLGKLVNKPLPNGGVSGGIGGAIDHEGRCLDLGQITVFQGQSGSEPVLSSRALTMFRSLTNDCVSLERESRQGRKSSIFPASTLGPWPIARNWETNIF